MAGWRQAVALAMTGEQIKALTALSRSRTSDLLFLLPNRERV